MIPEPGSYLIAFLKNGLKVEGEVVEWTDLKSILKSGSSYTVIPKTSEEVICYKFNKAKEKFNEIKEKPIKTQEDLKEVAELRKELNRIEKEEIRDKLSTIHEIGELKATTYGSIFNLPIKSTNEHSVKEASRTNSEFNSELQNLFSKRHKKY